MTDNTKTYLLSCPFCGSNAEEWKYQEEGNEPMWFVSCRGKNCSVHQTSIESAKEAREKWNHRVAL